MTKEELKAHCKRQIEGCEMWAKYRGEEPSGKIYEEHKLILELLEQETILDKIRAEILEYIDDLDIAAEICDIFDKYNAASEDMEQ